MTDTEYIEERLNNQIEWYDKKSSGNKKWYNLLKLLEIFCAALITLLSGMEVTIISQHLLLGGLGMLVAIAAAVGALYNFQENWVKYRATSELLKHEKYLYVTNTGPYAGQQIFSDFVQKIENILSKENTQWSQSPKGGLNQDTEPSAIESAG